MSGRMQKRQQYLFRGMSFLISLCFIFPTVSWAFQPESFPLPATAITLNRAHFDLPQAAGQIAEWHQGGAQTIICIQDLHCHYEVQKNIAKLIDYFVQRHQARLVGQEGAWGTVDADVLKSFPHPEIREWVGDFYVRQGKVTGAEYYTATSRSDIQLVGIENREAYGASQAAVRGFLNAESQGYCYDLADALEACKQRVYSPALLAWEQQHAAYREGRLDFLHFLLALRREAVKQRIPLAEYPEIQGFLERRKANRPMNLDQLYAECDRLNQRLHEVLCGTEAQRQLDRMARRLEIMERLINISVSPAELDEFRESREAFTAAALLEFFHTTDTEGELALELAGLEEYLRQAEEFYRLADLRSQQFVDNLLNRMEARQERLAVMINGGFHAQRVAAELKRRGVSYLMVRPQVSKLDMVNPYHALLQGRKLPLEKLLERNQDIMAVETAFNQAEFRSLLVAEQSALALAASKSIEGYLREHDEIALTKLRESSPEQSMVEARIQGRTSYWLVARAGVSQAATKIIAATQSVADTIGPFARIVSPTRAASDQVRVSLAGRGRLLLGQAVGTIARGLWNLPRVALTSLEKQIPGLTTRLLAAAAFAGALLLVWVMGSDRASLKIAANLLPPLAVAATILLAGIQFSDPNSLRRAWLGLVQGRDHRGAGVRELAELVSGMPMMQMENAGPGANQITAPATRGWLSRAEGETYMLDTLEREGDAWFVAMDLDNLSAYNEMYGKSLTNLVLDKILAAIVSGARGVKKLKVIRHGGDEIFVVMDQALPPSEVKTIVEKIRQAVPNALHAEFSAYSLQKVPEDAREKIEEILRDHPRAQLAWDDIYGPRLLIAAEGDARRAQQTAKAIEKLLAAQGFAEASLALINPFEGDESAKRISYLREGFLFTPTISAGAARSSSLPEEQRGDTLRDRLRATLVRSGDFLAAAKKAGKNKTSVEGRPGEGMTKLGHPDEGHTGASVLAPTLKEKILGLRDESAKNLAQYGNQRRLFDGLVSWVRSHDGLRQQLMEFFKSGAAKDLKERAIYIGRAPPSQGPDKIQLVLVDAQETYLVELEGHYRFEDPVVQELSQKLAAELVEQGVMEPNGDQLTTALQQLQVNGFDAFRFKAVNKISYQAGDEMILLPYYYLQANPGLFNLLRRRGNAIETNVAAFLTALEKIVNAEAENQIKVSFRAVLAKIDTPGPQQRYTAGINQLFREAMIASYAATPQQSIATYQPAQIGPAREELASRGRARAKDLAAKTADMQRGMIAEVSRRAASSPGVASLFHWMIAAAQARQWLGADRLGAPWVKALGMAGGALEAVTLAGYTLVTPLVAVSPLAIGLLLALILAHIPFMYLANVRGWNLVKQSLTQATVLLGYGLPVSFGVPHLTFLAAALHLAYDANAIWGASLRRVWSVGLRDLARPILLSLLDRVFSVTFWPAGVRERWVAVRANLAQPLLSLVLPITLKPNLDPPRPEDAAIVERLLAEGFLTPNELERCRDMAGHSMEQAYRFLARMERFVRNHQLEALLELAVAERNPLQSLMTFAPANDLAFLIEHAAALEKHGLAALVFLSRLRHERMTLITGGATTRAMALADRLEAPIKRFGIVAVVVMLEAYRQPAAGPGQILAMPLDIGVAATKAEDFFNRLPASVENLEQLRNYLMKQVFSGAQPNLAFAANPIFQAVRAQRFSLDQLLLLGRGERLYALVQALQELELLGPEHMERLGKAQAARVDAGNLVIDLHRQEPQAWAAWLQQLPWPAQDMALSELLIKNIGALITPTQAKNLLGQFFGDQEDPGMLHPAEALLLNSLHLHAEARAALASYYSRTRTHIQRAMMVRALAWLVEHPDMQLTAAQMIVKEQTDLPLALNLFPVMRRLQEQNILTLAQMETVAVSGNAAHALAVLLPEKIQTTFGITFERQSAEGREALSDIDFLIDLFNFHDRYANNPPAYQQLQALVKAYFEDGRAGVRRYKYSQRLASAQAPEAVREFLAQDASLTQLRGAAAMAQDRALFGEFFENALNNYDAHRQELKTDPATIQAAEAEELLAQGEAQLRAWAEAAGLPELALAIHNQDVEALKKLQPETKKDQRLKQSAIGLLLRLNAARQAQAPGQAAAVIEQIRGLRDLAASEQPQAVLRLLAGVQSQLAGLKQALRLQQEQMRDDPRALILSDQLGLLILLEQAAQAMRKAEEDQSVTAEVSFDLKEILKIGRYGSGGQGNCQNSTHAGDYNQSLMSFIGDAHELILLVRDNSGQVIGFALLHGVWTEDGASFGFVREAVYTNQASRTAIQESAVSDLTRQLASRLDVPVWVKDVKEGSDLKLKVPESAVDRYLDSIGGNVSSYGKEETIKAKVAHIAGRDLVRVGIVLALGVVGLALWAVVNPASLADLQPYVIAGTAASLLNYLMMVFSRWRNQTDLEVPQELASNNPFVFFHGLTHTVFESMPRLNNELAVYLTGIAASVFAGLGLAAVYLAAPLWLAGVVAGIATAGVLLMPVIGRRLMESSALTATTGAAHSGSAPASLAYWLLRATQNQGWQWASKLTEPRIKRVGLAGGIVEAVMLGAYTYGASLVTMTPLGFGLWAGLILAHVPLMSLAGLRGATLWRNFFEQAGILLGYGLPIVLGTPGLTLLAMAAHMAYDAVAIYRRPLFPSAQPLQAYLGEALPGYTRLSDHVLGRAVEKHVGDIFGPKFPLDRQVMIQRGWQFGVGYDFRTKEIKSSTARERLNQDEAVFTITIPFFLEGLFRQRMDGPGLQGRILRVLGTWAGNFVDARLTRYGRETMAERTNLFDAQNIEDWVDAYGGQRMAANLRQWQAGLSEPLQTDLYRRKADTPLGLTSAEVFKLIEAMRSRLHPGQTGLWQAIQPELEKRTASGETPTIDQVLAALQAVDISHRQWHAQPQLRQIMAGLQARLASLESEADANLVKLERSHLADLIIRSRNQQLDAQAVLRSQAGYMTEEPGPGVVWLMKDSERKRLAEAVAALMPGTDRAAATWLARLSQLLEKVSLDTGESAELHAWFQALNANAKVSAVAIGEEARLYAFAGSLATGRGEEMVVVQGQQSIRTVKPVLAHVVASSQDVIEAINRGQMSEEEVVILPYAGVPRKTVAETGNLQKDLAGLLARPAFAPSVQPRGALAQAYYRWHGNRKPSGQRQVAQVLLRIMAHQARNLSLGAASAPAAGQAYLEDLQALNRLWRESPVFRGVTAIGTYRGQTVFAPSTASKGEKLRILWLWSHANGFEPHPQLEEQINRERLRYFRISSAA